MIRHLVHNMCWQQWCIGGYTRVYGVYQPPGVFWQRMLTSAIINKQGTFSPFATPLCIYPPPFLAIHHWLAVCFWIALAMPNWDVDKTMKQFVKSSGCCIRLQLRASSQVQNLPTLTRQQTTRRAVSVKTVLNVASSSRLLELDPQPLRALHFPLATPPCLWLASRWLPGHTHPRTTVWPPTPSSPTTSSRTLALRCGAPIATCAARTPTRATVRPTPTCGLPGVVMRPTNVLWAWVTVFGVTGVTEFGVTTIYLCGLLWPTFHAAWSLALQTLLLHATRGVVLLRCGLFARGGSMTYLAAPPALDRPRCNLTSRQSLQLSECGLLPLTRQRACQLTHTRLSLELDIVIFHPAR